MGGGLVAAKAFRRRLPVLARLPRQLRATGRLKMSARVCCNEKKKEKRRRPTPRARETAARQCASTDDASTLVGRPGWRASALQLLLADPSPPPVQSSGLASSATARGGAGASPPPPPATADGWRACSLAASRAATARMPPSPRPPVALRTPEKGGTRGAAESDGRGRRAPRSGGEAPPPRTPPRRPTPSPPSVNAGAAGMRPRRSGAAVRATVAETPEGPRARSACPRAGHWYGRTTQLPAVWQASQQAASRSPGTKKTGFSELPGGAQHRPSVASAAATTAGPTVARPTVAAATAAPVAEGWHGSCSGRSTTAPRSSAVTAPPEYTASAVPAAAAPAAEAATTTAAPGAARAAVRVAAVAMSPVTAWWSPTRPSTPST